MNALDMTALWDHRPPCQTAFSAVSSRGAWINLQGSPHDPRGCWSCLANQLDAEEFPIHLESGKATPFRLTRWNAKSQGILNNGKTGSKRINEPHERDQKHEHSILVPCPSEPGARTRWPLSSPSTCPASSTLAL
jgi:hypothetical protein